MTFMHMKILPSHLRSSRFSLPIWVADTVYLKKFSEDNVFRCFIENIDTLNVVLSNELLFMALLPLSVFNFALQCLWTTVVSVIRLYYFTLAK